MTPVLLLQNNYFSKLGRIIQPCLDFCAATGMEFVDRSLTDEFDPDTLGIDESGGVMVYGSVGWMKRIQKSGLSLWIDYDRQAFATSTWGSVFGEEALNGDGFLVGSDELRDRILGGERFHVRPDQEDKAFVGAVYDRDAWVAMERLRAEERRSPLEDVACWASPLKTIDAEHRCWFVDGEFVDASTYRKDGERHVERVADEGIVAEARRLAGIYLPVGNVVLDVAETPDGPKVIEFNPIHGSGWYAADTDLILGTWSEHLSDKAATVYTP